MPSQFWWPPLKEMLTWPHSSRDARGEGVPCLLELWVATGISWHLGLWLWLFLPHTPFPTVCLISLCLRLLKIYMRACRDYVNNPASCIHFKILILMASAETLFLSKMVTFRGSPGLDVDIFWGPFSSLPHLHSIHFHSYPLILLKYLSLSENNKIKYLSLSPHRSCIYTSNPWA